MIPLTAHGQPHNVIEPIIGRITTAPSSHLKPKAVLAIAEWPSRLSGDFVAVLCANGVASADLTRISLPVVHSINLHGLTDGDVVRIDGRGRVRTLYRRQSRHNTLFATERCNSLCLMCSQPPREVDDNWRIDEMIEVVRLVDPSTAELGITGGEPTLLKEGFLRVVQSCKDYLPTTSLHVLSNGRLFRYSAFAGQLGAISHPDLMIGIPVYSDLDHEHDYVVQAKGAFEDTMSGLHNLARAGVPVEVRVVINRLTYRRLPQLSEFIYRNLTFASHVALMGLEITGYTIPNLDQLWIDPYDYQYELEEATLALAVRGVNVSVYNHQLCTVSQSVWPYCRQSISDWKNEYLAACDQCGVRTLCGGFFAAGIQRRYSSHISPLTGRDSAHESQRHESNT